MTTRYPPAVDQEDAYNLVKFYTLERSLVWSIMAATFTEKLEFPFLPDEAEHLIISLTERRCAIHLCHDTTFVIPHPLVQVCAAYRTLGHWQDDHSGAAHVAQVPRLLRSRSRLARATSRAGRRT
jgi:hypothetical protein